VPLPVIYPEQCDVKRDAMFKEVAERRTSKRRRWSVVLSVLYLGLAALNAFSFWKKREDISAMNACLWLAVAVAWAYRSRHVGEPQITKLDIESSKELDDNE
jgi:hypothetical protein